MAKKSFIPKLWRRLSVLSPALALAGLFVMPFSLIAQENEAEDATAHAHADEQGIADSEGKAKTDIWAIARGGQLYDNWASVIGKSLPEETHPAYPADAKKKGGSTWRCKECHGWDYKGSRGAYAKGSHFTGIKGLRDMVGINPEIIHQTLMDNTHRLTEEIMPHLTMEQLALFISRGQFDMDLYINRETNESRGDPGRGANYFQTICAVCHGFDGKAINFKTQEKPEYVGTVASHNPWEFLHKVRFGQPGVPMISLITLPVTDLVDILAFAQTLPVE